MEVLPKELWDSLSSDEQTVVRLYLQCEGRRSDWEKLIEQTYGKDKVNELMFSPNVLTAISHIEFTFSQTFAADLLRLQRKAIATLEEVMEDRSKKSDRYRVLAALGVLRMRSNLVPDFEMTFRAQPSETIEKLLDLPPELRDRLLEGDAEVLKELDM